MIGSRPTQLFHPRDAAAFRAAIRNDDDEQRIRRIYYEVNPRSIEDFREFHYLATGIRPRLFTPIDQREHYARLRAVKESYWDCNTPPFPHDDIILCVGKGETHYRDKETFQVLDGEDRWPDWEEVVLDWTKTEDYKFLAPEYELQYAKRQQRRINSQVTEGHTDGRRVLTRNELFRKGLRVRLPLLPPNFQDGTEIPRRDQVAF